MITISINGKHFTVADGTTVAAAVLNAGETAFRTSVSGEARGPLCGMGICFECRLTINGEPHIRSCTILAEDGMEVLTGE
ncbi:MAG: (2Fe-2S)-binding protein [Acidobacteria bacterium]|nr:(2Fe-2S)-binding protein [Acidobacteriota bacterium]